jgi:hypothetical protein
VPGHRREPLCILAPPLRGCAAACETGAARRCIGQRTTRTGTLYSWCTCMPRCSRTRRPRRAPRRPSSRTWRLPWRLACLTTRAALSSWSSCWTPAVPPHSRFPSGPRVASFYSSRDATCPGMAMCLKRIAYVRGCVMLPPAVQLRLLSSGVCNALTCLF